MFFLCLLRNNINLYCLVIFISTHMPYFRPVANGTTYFLSTTQKVGKKVSADENFAKNSDFRLKSLNSPNKFGFKQQRFLNAFKPNFFNANFRRREVNRMASVPSLQTFSKTYWRNLLKAIMRSFSIFTLFAIIAIGRRSGIL